MNDKNRRIRKKLNSNEWKNDSIFTLTLSIIFQFYFNNFFFVNFAIVDDFFLLNRNIRK